jgi:MFS family permease
MTKYCAAFVAMSALGLAIGPGIASLLDMIPDFKFMGISFNTYTIPGFVSFVMWIFFSLIMLKYFKEPNVADANYNKLAE